ncbi:hypothetical protein BXZ70DRAFT_936295 [Cristinia sonorae]|uniref:C2H2-type domain-containing protein n=1 Tax=Cristinia sonorae TaxID=1940300 RepID=A0A8K0XQ75_9AGAR|nr:hypothetical protein BXZ70DRAFT_936295 [Cristinia sonorae]
MADYQADVLYYSGTLYAHNSSGLLDMDAVLPEGGDIISATSTGLVHPGVAKARARDVIEGIKLREKLVHDQVLAGPFFAPRKPTPSVMKIAVQGDAGSLETESTERRSSMDSTLSYSSATTASSGSFYSVDLNSPAEAASPRVRFTKVLAEEVRQAILEAKVLCDKTGRTTSIACERADCAAILPTMNGLVAHLHMHNMEVVGPLFTCKGCDFENEDKAYADEHRRACMAVIRDCDSPPPSATSSGKQPLLFSTLDVTDCSSLSGGGESFMAKVSAWLTGTF